MAIKQRIITAVIALPLLILLIGCAGATFFSFFIAFVLFLSLLEFNRMGLGDEFCFERWFAAAMGTCFVPFQLSGNYGSALVLAMTGFLLLATLFLFHFQALENVHHQLSWLLLGFFYLLLPLGHLIALRLLPDGRQWIFLTLLVIMSCDSCAYFIGRKIGKRKLYPAVSPNKSVEGALGGLVGSILAVFLAKLTFLPLIGFFDGLALGLVLGTAGQLGDLFESLLKRACGVKDSGTIIPGHGGLLDRLDSLLFAFPLVYYVARYGYGG